MYFSIGIWVHEKRIWAEVYKHRGHVFWQWDRGTGGTIAQEVQYKDRGEINSCRGYSHKKHVLWQRGMGTGIEYSKRWGTEEMDSVTCTWSFWQMYSSKKDEGTLYCERRMGQRGDVLWQRDGCTLYSGRRDALLEERCKYRHTALWQKTDVLWKRDVDIGTLYYKREEMVETIEHRIEKNPGGLPFPTVFHG